MPFLSRGLNKELHVFKVCAHLDDESHISYDIMDYFIRFLLIIKHHSGGKNFRSLDQCKLMIENDKQYVYSVALSYEYDTQS